MKRGIIIITWLYLLAACTPNAHKNASIEDDHLVIEKGGKRYVFTPQFTVIYSAEDPRLAMRPAGIEGVNYNVATWQAYAGKAADLTQTAKDETEAGDGFDRQILEGKANARTPNPCHAGQEYNVTATALQQAGDTLRMVFPTNEVFSLEAFVIPGKGAHPLLTYRLTPKQAGYFSVGYTGAPVYELAAVKELWQPLIWQEKRFPEQPVMTLAYRAPLPTTLVYDGTNSVGVMAAPEEYPFNPLPVMKNSRFGVMVRNQNGQAQSQLFSPVPGGINAHMKPGAPYAFRAYLVVAPGDVTTVYEKLARDYFDFHDYRQNAISTLNQTLDHIVDYAKSDYAWFLDSLKGCAYSTDVPGAVKNVSSLNPLELALVMDDATMLEERAYPIMEYMLSREKFLFSLDSTQKIQHPSRKLTGPIAPVSELVSLYNIFGRHNPFLLTLAKEEYRSTRVRNLDVAEAGKNWVNAMHLYEATEDSAYLRAAMAGADAYIATRVDSPQTAFDDPEAGGFFFWPAFTPKWIALTRLYEITGAPRYLTAAHQGARHYTMFTWMSPRIPDSLVTVNKGGQAPMYWYLERKGHHPMYYPEAQVPAWRLSEMGLTPESSGTSTGHRAIFMANYAPWMLRVGYYAHDAFLKEVAKAAIIGRYRNFPGYHINTARTTAYEQEDFPLHAHKDLSVNSFHYNHIMPMASMLLDYLVTDAFVRSDGRIHFPAQYIEGYAYMQDQFYGDQPGSFYGEEGVQLWMPTGLLTINNVELNYIAGYKDHQLYLAFMNQSAAAVSAEVTFDETLVTITNPTLDLLAGEASVMKEATHTLQIKVAPNGITVVKIGGITPHVNIQQKLLSLAPTPAHTYQTLDVGHARAMLITMGQYTQRVYVYLRDDDAVFSSVALTYYDTAGHPKTLRDRDYPYEFTVPVLPGQRPFRFQLEGTTVSGKVQKSKVCWLGE